MKKIKLFLFILFTLIMMNVSSCSEDGETPHQHNFDGAWFYNNTTHWKVCSCGEIDKEESHIFLDEDRGYAISGTEKTEFAYCSTCHHQFITKVTTHICDYYVADYDSSKHYLSCEECWKIINESHNYEWEVITQPTEEAYGREKGICTVCGYGKTRNIAKLEHTHTVSEEWSKDESYHWHEVDCGKPEHIADKEAHTYDCIYTIATCTEGGIITYTCTKCKITNTSSETPLGHEIATRITPSTCITKGKRETYCSRCNEILNVEELELIYHTFDKAVITKPRTCTENGEETYTCKICNYTITDSIDPLGHIKATRTTPATCTKNGKTETYCTRCNLVLSEKQIPATEHSEAFRTITPATCTSKGEKEVYCYSCKIILNKEEIPMGPHDWDSGVITTPATCTENGERTFTCRNCKTATITEQIIAYGHKMIARDRKIPTTREAGYQTYVCSRCAETVIEVFERKIIPSTAVSLDTLGAKSIITDADLESYGVSATSIPAKINGATYYKFGVYPQTIKAAEVTVDETIINLEFDEVDYYLGSDNNWYAKCIENAYMSSYKYSDGTTVAQSSANSTKYFKVEPIVWRKLEGSGYLLAEKVLTANVGYYPYNYEISRYGGYTDIIAVNRRIDANIIYPNNYEHSRIRAFLNGYKYVSKKSDSAEQIDNEDFCNKGFLQTAFTQNQRSQILTTTVDNSANSTTDSEGNLDVTTICACSNTQDKIFLLSELEVTTTSNGFTAYNMGDVGNSRIRVPTDYAKANYAYHTTPAWYAAGYGAYWLLRSPTFDGNYYKTRGVDIGGSTEYIKYVFDCYIGIVPALSVTE